MKTLHFSLSILLLLVLLNFASSCNGSCNCYREIKCTTLSAVSKDDPSIVIEKKIICSVKDYRVDQAYQDSLGRFYQRHYNDNINFLQKDSTLLMENKLKVKSKDVDAVQKNGFSCECFK